MVVKINFYLGKKGNDILNFYMTYTKGQQYLLLIGHYFFVHSIVCLIIILLFQKNDTRLDGVLRERFVLYVLKIKKLKEYHKIGFE